MRSGLAIPKSSLAGEVSGAEKLRKRRQAAASKDRALTARGPATYDSGFTGKAPFGDMEQTKVGIVGLGTVGSGVARLLLDYGDRTARHAGRTLWLEQVVVRDLRKARDCNLPKGLLSNDLAKITG